ncbi:MAG: magnesium transporter [Candidatus Aenigmarchaeota archaeon]|nr:magnesium transporter [Candidatus Aenigmarchaeota archaeon]
MPDGKKFPPNTAGGKMISTVPIANIGQTISEIEGMLLRTAKNFKTLDYVYVVDEKSRLRGVASIKEILQVPRKSVKIEKIMKKDLVVAHPLTHQETVVYLALKNNIKAVPVVDKENHLLGIVPYDTILQTFHKEVHEDIFRFVGIHGHIEKELNVIKAPTSTMVKARLPWLIVGLVGGMIAASVVGVFENVLGAYLALAMFMPVLVYMSDAIGTQSETLIVRSIAINPKLSIKAYMLREFKVATYLALFCGIFLAIAAMLGLGTYLLGLVVGLSMFLSIIVAVFIATFLPFILRKLKLDPAVATGPFATVITDILTLAVYFSVASIFLTYLA